jgi:hypothetical protein
MELEERAKGMMGQVRPKLQVSCKRPDLVNIECRE